MLSSTSLLTSLLFFSTSLVAGTKAPIIPTNPKGVVAIADFPFGYDLDVTGNIVFTAKGGKAVNVHVDMSLLPSEGGPFLYHIHDKSVPSNGNCDLVGPHFNPYNGFSNCSEQKCNGYCELGDLSGKHGTINDTSFEVTYDDPYLSLNKKSKSYIVGKSIAFHFANLTRFACADIELAGNLRLHNLLEEYAESENSDLDQIIQDLTSPDVFDEDKALLDEVFEDDPSEKDQKEYDEHIKEEIEDDKHIKEEIEDDKHNKEEIEDGKHNKEEKEEDKYSKIENPLDEQNGNENEANEDNDNNKDSKDKCLEGECSEDNNNKDEVIDEDKEEKEKEKVEVKYSGDDKHWKYKYNYSNSTNCSRFPKNSTYNVYSDDYENGSSLKSFALSVAFAGLIGLLI